MEPALLRFRTAPPSIADMVCPDDRAVSHNLSDIAVAAMCGKRATRVDLADGPIIADFMGRARSPAVDPCAQCGS